MCVVIGANLFLLIYNPLKMSVGRLIAKFLRQPPGAEGNQISQFLFCHLFSIRCRIQDCLFMLSGPEPRTPLTVLGCYTRSQQTGRRMAITQSRGSNFSAQSASRPSGWMRISLGKRLGDKLLHIADLVMRGTISSWSLRLFQNEL